MKEIQSHILRALQKNPRGLTILEIANITRINRNSAAKHLEVLLVSGKVDLRTVGRAKMFFISNRIPISALLDFSTDLIVIISQDLEIMQVNDSFCDFFGANKENIIGKNIDNSELIIFKNDTLSKKINKSLKGKQNTFNLDLTSKKGIEYFEVRIIPTTYDEGTAAITIILTNITKRKLSEINLKKSEERFRDLAEQSPNMIFINYRGKIVYANRKCSEIMHYSLEEFLSPAFDFLVLIAPKFRDEVKSALNRQLNNEEITPFEYTIITKEGKKIEVLYSSKLIKYESEQAILGTITDVSTLKELIRKLQKSRTMYIAVTNLTGDIIVRADLDGNWTFLNNVACLFWGRSREELIGRKFADYLHPEDIEKTNKVLQSMIKSRKIKSLRNRQLTPDGWKEVNWFGAPIFNEKGEYIGLQASGRVVQNNSM